MRIGPLHPSFDARIGRRAGARRDAVEPLSTPDLPNHAARPVEAGAAVESDLGPERRPLPPSRALVAPSRAVTRLADALAAARLYAAPRERVSPFPAGSLVSLAV